MEHHLSDDELQGYGRGAMNASALLDADRHLAGCAVCRRQLRHTVPAPRLPEDVLAMGEPVHLTYEQMAAHVDARLSEAELTQVEQHRAICRRCDQELADLQAFDARMTSEFSQAVPKPGEQVQPRANWLQTARAAWADFFAAPARLRFAGAGVALMFLGAFTLLQSGRPVSGTPVAAHVTANLVATSAATHPHLFYGGFVVLGCGLASLLYGMCKR